MIKKEVTYVDFNGTERTEPFYFNFTEAELMAMELTTETGLSTRYEEILKSKDRAKIAELFEFLLLNSYGEKSEDGKYFNKTDEIRNRFKASAAYSTIYTELLQNSEKAIEFSRGILPKTVTSKAVSSVIV